MAPLAEALLGNIRPGVAARACSFEEAEAGSADGSCCHEGPCSASLRPHRRPPGGLLPWPPALPTAARPRAAAASAFLSRRAATTRRCRVAFIDAIPEGAIAYPPTASAEDEADGEGADDEGGADEGGAAEAVQAASLQGKLPPPRDPVLYPPREDGPLKVGSVEEMREKLIKEEENEEVQEVKMARTAQDAIV
mmetsp:Transcript_86305/g.268128  ORF Transcript_86305/g.268128 Transcript_86305/m.268128 type:complete len:194 (-) Transcript_86305:69-650(-)